MSIHILCIYTIYKQTHCFSVFNVRYSEHLAHWYLTKYFMVAIIIYTKLS